jgi:hypothetical protein
VKLHTALVALAALAATPAFAAKPQIQWDESYDFSTIKTFQWDNSPESLEGKNPFMHSRVVAAIENELTAVGLTKVQANGDVHVTYHTSMEQQVRLNSTSFGYGFGGYGGVGWGHYGYGYGGPVSTTTSVDTYEEGTLVVDIWDSDTKTLIWRGTATRVFSENVEKAEAQVVEIIEKMGAQSKKLRARAAKEAAERAEKAAGT